MKLTRIPLLTGSFLRLASGVVLWLSASAWGQTAPSDEMPAVKPTVTVERQGPVLVLTYRLLGAEGQPAGPSAAGSRPAFTIHQGKRLVAAGPFAFG